MEKGLVSICIPCYNSEKYVGDCLQAILEQTYRKVEVIIVDDGSKDKTHEIIKEYEKKFKDAGMHFMIIYQENSGQAVAINTALKYVNGEFLTWQDSDDCYAKDGIRLLKEYLEFHRDMQFVRGEVAKMDEEMVNVVEYGKSKYPTVYDIFDFYVFETDSYCWPGIFMVRLDFFDKCIKDREIYVAKAGQNLALILPLAYCGQCGYVNKVVYNYRIREDSFYHSVKEIDDLIKREDEHKKLLLAILDRIGMSAEKKAIYVKKIDYKYVKIKRFLAVENFLNSEKCFFALQDFCLRHKITTVAIYGLGNFGKKLMAILKKIDVEVCYAIDKDAHGMSIAGIKAVTLEDRMDKVDVIIITSPNNFEEMVKELNQKGVSNFITLEDIMKEEIV